MITIKSAPARVGARIMGIGAYRPTRVVTNDEIAPLIDSSDEWIQQRTGINSRRFANELETLEEMAALAATEAIADAKIKPAQIGVVLVATLTNPVQFPAVAPTIATRLGIPDPGAFDVGAACAGFVYALSTAADMVKAGSVEYALVIGAERMTDVLDMTDRSSAFIFGDGAGAFVVGPADFNGFGPIIFGSDGSQAEAISMTSTWFDFRSGKVPEPPTLRMECQQVFRWAVSEMVGVAQRAITAAGLEPKDLAAFIPHQANNRITDAIVKALDFPDSVAIARDIRDSGNTTAATVPLALHALRSEGRAPAGAPALLLGFGAGLTYAAQVVALP
jgi:3-oxoacyl-[acyl-carrier-protein] synthase III